MHKRLFCISLFLLALCAPVQARQPRLLTPELLWQFGRVSDGSVSPDGQSVVFGITRYDVAENKGSTDLYHVPTLGGAVRRLTETPASESGAQWRPDGRRIGYLSSQSGSMQLWEILPDGGDARQVTNHPGGITGFLYAPTSRRILFTADVKLDSTVQDLYQDLPKADARILDGLLYRHWDAWSDYAYSHVFAAAYNDGALSDVRDLLEGEPFDAPLQPFGGLEQIAWSPDGGRIAYTSKKLRGTQAAVSTNSDIYVYDFAGGATTNVSAGMPGYDTEPRFSPDGRRIAWLSMARDGYEADPNRLFVADAGGGARTELTAGFDQTAHAPVWAPDGKALYFTSDIAGTVHIYRVSAAGGAPQQVTRGTYNYGAPTPARAGGKQYLVASRTSMSAPAELYRIDTATGEAAPLTQVNAEMLAGLQLARVEQRMVPTTDGKQMLVWMIYPPGFDPSRKYPALLYAQGGPQSPVSQSFSYRWNFQLMAAEGYIVVAPNRRGLPGFGQAWNEQISGDWGGQSMQDLLTAIDAAAREPYVDAERLGAVGASYGGYSVYWLAGHHQKRFKTFVAHAGVFNLESMYGATEELFFVNFDLKGAYWDQPRPKSYDAFSPHRFVGAWDTPMLVIHGEKDFRVPVTEGMQAFTALQLKGIPSRFLYFPEEGHWILKPQNGILWHRVFFDWLDRSLKP